MKTRTREERQNLIIQIMQEDEKDGLYDTMGGNHFPDIKKMD